MEGGPMTRSRRNLITESAEKENINSAPGTPIKNSDSIDTSPSRMNRDVISSPARITRNRKSLSLCSNPLDSPSKNLRKKNGSPQSVKSSPMKLNTPKKSEDGKKSSIAEMTPTKRLLKRNESILSTVDSPKPRRPRYSLSDAPESNLDTSVRRSRRLSTDLPVVKEDPISESVIEPIVAAVPKIRRGKRMSVAPSQPALPEENEFSDTNSDKIEAEITNDQRTIESPDENNRTSPKSVSLKSPTNSNDSLGEKSGLPGFSPKNLLVILDKCNRKSLEKKESPSNTKRSSLNVSSKAELKDSPKNSSIITESDINQISHISSEVKEDADKSTKSSELSYEESPNETFLNFKLDDSSDDLNSSNKSNQSKKKRLSAKDVFIQENSEMKEISKEKSFSSKTSNVESNSSSFETNIEESTFASPLSANKSKSMLFDIKDNVSPKFSNFNKSIKDSENYKDSDDIVVLKVRESLSSSKTDSSLNTSNLSVKNKRGEDSHDNITDVESESKFNTSKSIRNKSLNVSNLNSGNKMDLESDTDIITDADTTKHKSKLNISKSESNKSLDVSSSSIKNKSNVEFRQNISDIDVDANVSKGSKSKTRFSNFESNKSFSEEEIIDNDANATMISMSEKRNSSTGENKSLNISNSSNKSRKSFNNEDVVDTNTSISSKSKKRLSSTGENKSLNFSNKSKSDKSLNNEDIVDVDTDITTTSKSKKRLSSTGENKSMNISNKSKSDKSLNIEDIVDVDTNTTITSMSKKRLSSTGENKSLNISNKSKSDKSFNNEDIVDVDTIITTKSKKRLSSIENNNSLNMSNSSIKSKSNKSLDEKNIDIVEDAIGISKFKRLSSTDKNKSLNTSKSSTKNKKNSLTASTPLNINKSGNKSINEKEASQSYLSNESMSECFSNSESPEDDSSDGKNSLLELSAFDAGSDYLSGDSMDESERREIEENEIHGIVETLTSDSEEEDTDDTYEKDSFICFSEDETLLSGTGDDLSSGEELTQSAKSKAKYNKKQEEKQKRASREMFLARHSGENSPSKPKNKLRIESDDSILSVNDEVEISNVSIKTAPAKDPLSISAEIVQTRDSSLKTLDEDENSNMSSDADDLDIRNTFNEELKKLQNIDIESNSSSDEEPAESKDEKLTIQGEENEYKNSTNTKVVERKTKSVLNKSEGDIKSKTKNNSNKLNKSSILENEKSQSRRGDSTLSSVEESIEKLRKMDESVTKIFTSLMNRVDKVTYSIDANFQNSPNSKPEFVTEENESEDLTTIAKRKIESVDSNSLENPQKKMCISDNVKLEKKESLSCAPEKMIDNKSKQVPNCLKISDKSKAIKRRKTSISDMKTEKISNAADKLRCIPSDLIEQKKETRVTATSNFKVELKNAYQNEVTCTDTAGKFSVMPTASTKDIYNSTTNFKVIPLRKHPKQAIQVDKVLASNFVDFKKTMLTGKNIKRESSSNLRKNKQKFNARQKAGKW